MNKIIETMLSKNDDSNKENAIKEIVQEIVLSGLSRGGFFDRAVFYGGTCLRIFHHLDRFSEDLDFALISKDKSFKLEDYFPSIQKELLSYGLDMEVIKKDKGNDHDIQSAFVKGNTKILLLSFYPKGDVNNIANNQVIKIKFEIDIDNPDGGVIETRYRLLPSPYEIKIFDESTLFAGKIHAIICRAYKKRIKGRDYYDYLFYCAKNTKINLLYLENKLKNSGILDKNTALDISLVKKLLKEKFVTVDYELAKQDVLPFINNGQRLDFWNKELFLSTLEELQ